MFESRCLQNGFVHLLRLVITRPLPIAHGASHLPVALNLANLGCTKVAIVLTNIPPNAGESIRYRGEPITTRGCSYRTSHPYGSRIGIGLSRCGEAGYEIVTSYVRLLMIAVQSWMASHIHTGIVSGYMAQALLPAPRSNHTPNATTTMPSRTPSIFHAGLLDQCSMIALSGRSGCIRIGTDSPSGNSYHFSGIFNSEVWYPDP